MTNTSVVDLDADLVRSWGKDLDILKRQLFTGLPGDSSLASDCLSRG